MLLHELYATASIPVGEISDPELGRISTTRFFAANPKRTYFARPALPKERPVQYFLRGVIVAKRDATVLHGFESVWLTEINPAAFAVDVGEEVARALFGAAMQRDRAEAAQKKRRAGFRS